jgi:predicted alpha/beta superfamily hydrolase
MWAIGLSCLLLALAMCPAVAPAAAPFLAATKDGLDSQVLHQKRRIEVYLPSESATDAGARYETLYVLDGDWNAQIVVDVLGFMRQVGLVPPVIVVSVPNFFDAHGINSRDHDLTPTVSVEQAHSGGAAEFLAFLKTELVPYVDAHYPTNRVHLVHGHSYGGLFLIYALLHEPALFDGYAVLDPALRWDKHALDAALDAHLADTPAAGKTVYIAGREGVAFEDMGIASAKAIFERKAPRDLHWKFVAYADETHDSLKLKATYDALRYAWQGYTGETVRLVPNGGVLVKGKPLFVAIDGGGFDRFDLHYSTDGSVPTQASPRAVRPFLVADPGNTQVRLLSNRGVFDRVLPLNLTIGSFLAPAPATRASADWKVAWYAPPAWPDLRHARAFRTTHARSRLDFGAIGREAFAGSVERNVQIPAEGYYVLGIATPDKARVTLAGQALVEQDGATGTPHEAFIVPLQRGVYPLRVDFLCTTKTSQLDFIIFRVKDGEAEWWNNELLKLTSRREP